MYEAMMGFGVAGNFAGHLEQAGEASDFVGVQVQEKHAPKGMFPFYVPGLAGQLGVYPVSSRRIVVPEAGGNLQIEPEVVLVVDLAYRDERVVSLTPRRFGAYNDCSIRRPNARKISEKKNWGPQSKGVASDLIEIDHFSRGGVMDRYRLGCYLLRDGELHTYGVDSALLGYSYFYQTLADWMIVTLNEQQDAGPLEHLHGLLRQTGFPAQALVGIGATRYTPYGETTFLKSGDVAYVAVYDETRYDTAALTEIMREGREETRAGLSLLRQTIETGDEK